MTTRETRGGKGSDDCASRRTKPRRREGHEALLVPFRDENYLHLKLNPMMAVGAVGNRAQARRFSKSLWAPPFASTPTAASTAAVAGVSGGNDARTRLSFRDETRRASSPAKSCQ